MSHLTRDDGKRIPDELWYRMKDCLGPTITTTHPLGCHRPRLSDRVVMDAVLLVLRTGSYWNALSLTGICSSSTAHRRFTEWMNAGVFERLRERGILSHEFLGNIDWHHVINGGHGNGKKKRRVRQVTPDAP
jgi:transposase